MIRFNSKGSLVSNAELAQCRSSPVPSSSSSSPSKNASFSELRQQMEKHTEKATPKSAAKTPTLTAAKPTIPVNIQETRFCKNRERRRNMRRRDSNELESEKGDAEVLERVLKGDSEPTQTENELVTNLRKSLDLTTKTEIEKSPTNVPIAAQRISTNIPSPVRRSVTPPSDLKINIAPTERECVGAGENKCEALTPSRKHLSSPISDEGIELQKISSTPDSHYDL